MFSNNIIINYISAGLKKKRGSDKIKNVSKILSKMLRYDKILMTVNSQCKGEFIVFLRRDVFEKGNIYH